MSFSWKLAILLVLSASLYVTNLTGFALEDDEGECLYPAWRMTLGEKLYTDLPVSQTPGIFWLGAALFNITGPSLDAARITAALAALWGILCMYFWVRIYLSSSSQALTAAFLLAVDPMYFTMARFFRTDIFMLAAMITGLFLLAAGQNAKQQTIFYILAGIFFAIAVLFKPFALIIFVVTAFYGYRQKSRLYFPASFLLIIGLSTCWLYLDTPSMFSQYFGQHFSSHFTHSWQDNLTAKSDFLGNMIKTEWFLWFTGIGGILLWNKGRPVPSGNSLMLLTCLGTAIFFLFLKREVYPRHLFYLAPIFCLLTAKFAFAFDHKGLRSMLPLGIIIVFTALNSPPLELLLLSEDESACLAEVVASRTKPDELVLTDYAYINFNTQRRGLRISSYIDEGAITSGKLTSQAVIKNIMKEQPALILIHVAGMYRLPYGRMIFYLTPSHLAKLPDFENFIQTLDNIYHKEWITCGLRTYLVYTRNYTI